MNPIDYSPFQPTLTCEGQKHLGFTLQIKRPCLALSDKVYAFVEVKTDQPTMYPVVPDGTNILFFSRRHESFGGTQSSILDVSLNAPEETYFGIWFLPGKLRHFFDIDLSEASDKLIGMDFLENRMFLTLQERLYEKGLFTDRISCCEALLLGHTTEQKIPDKFTHAQARIYESAGVIRVNELADEVGWSARHLNRHFLLHTGLTSKAFAQTVRLNHYLKALYQNNHSYLHQGLDLGFYDQSHILKSITQQGLNQLSLISRHLMSDFYKPTNK